MIEQLLAIVRNTYFESIRQPVALVVVVTAGLLILLSNPLSAFTMEDDHRMLLDIGLATIFAAGAILAAFIATNVIGDEIENKTALTVVSKPVGRPIFVIGKFLGVGGALLTCVLALAMVFLLVEMHGVRERTMDPYHLPVIFIGSAAAIAGTVVAVWCNYFYNKSFASTSIAITTPLLLLAYVICMNFEHDFTPQAMSIAFRFDLWKALIPLGMAILVLTAIAVAASTRLGQVMTLTITLGMFLLGMLADWFFGRPINAMQQLWTRRAREEGLTEQVETVREITTTYGETIRDDPRVVDVATVPLTQMAEGAELIQYALYKIGYAALPNIQVLWLADALTQRHVIPTSYLLQACLYGGLYIVMALCAGIILFQRREVG